MVEVELTSASLKELTTYYLTGNRSGKISLDLDRLYGLVTDEGLTQIGFAAQSLLCNQKCKLRKGMGGKCESLQFYPFEKVKFTAGFEVDPKSNVADTLKNNTNCQQVSIS